MTTFFSVDVETGNLTPWSVDGFLLSVGIEAIDEASLESRGEFYVRLDRTEDLDGSWWEARGEYDPVSDTQDWWLQQGDIAQDEAFRDRTLVRHDEETAARMIREFVCSREQEPEGRIFVANPVAFDKMWVDELFSTSGVENPFHYRSLCLRSMKYGLRPHSRWGGDRETHAPLIPHHALHDAKAQALDLVAMLTERDEPKDL